MQSPPLTTDESLRLASLSQCKVLDTPPEERFDRLTRIASAAFDVPIALVSLVDENRQWFKSRVGLDATETPREISFCGHAIHSDAILEVRDATADPRFHDNPLVTGAPSIRFYAGAPLRSPDGRRLGTLCLIDHKPRELDVEQRARLRDMADCVEQELARISTERLEAALTQQRKRTDEMLKVFPDLVFVIDRNGRFTECLPHPDLFAPPEVVIGQTVDAILPNPLATTCLEAIQRVLRDGEDSVFTYDLNLPVGHKRYEARLRRIDEGEVLIASRDVTPLHESEERLRLAQRAAGVGIWDWDLAGDRIAWDAECSRMLGGPDEPRLLDYQTWRSLVHPGDLTAIEPIVAEGLADGGRFVIEFRYLRDDGGWLWVQGRGQVVERDENGVPTRMIGTHTDIDAGHVAREQAKMFAERLHRIAENVPGVVYQFQLWPDGRSAFPYASEGLREIYGVAPEEAATDASAVFSAIHPEDLEAVREGILRSADELTRWRQSYRVLTNGHERWVDGEALPQRQADGSTLWHGYIRDVTERKLIEEALEHSREDLIRAQRVARIGSWTKELSGDDIEWSAETYRIFGLPEGQPIDGVLFTELVHPDDRERVGEAWNQALETGHYDIEHRILAGGEIRWVRELAEFLRDEEGRPTHALGTVQDVTERRSIEATLVESEARFKQMAEAVEVVFWVRTADQMLYISPAYERLWGRSAERLMDDASDFVESIHPDDRESVLAQLQKELYETGLFDSEYRIVRPDGEIRWIHATSRPIRGSDRSAGTAYDITARKIAEEGLARSNEELEQFAYVASHDLRQPLRMVNSYIQLLERRLEQTLDDETRMMMSFAVEGARRMDQMLVSLLEYSRIGRSAENRQWLSSRALLDEALHFLSPAITEAEASLSVSGDWPIVHVCRDELSRLLQNLISNAVKYRQPNTAPRIRITGHYDSQGWHCCIEDDGIGIDPNHTERVFMVFQRLHARNEYEGNGIGLAVARKIVDGHGGRIWVESEGKGHGSRFCFTLPRKQVQAGAVLETST